MDGGQILISLATKCYPLPINLRNVLVPIADYAGSAHTGFGSICYASMETIALDAGCSVSTVKRMVNALDALGIIRVSRSSGRNPNAIRVNQGWLEAVWTTFRQVRDAARLAGEDHIAAIKAKAAEMQSHLFVHGVEARFIPPEWNQVPNAISPVIPRPEFVRAVLIKSKVIADDTASEASPNRVTVTGLAGKNGAEQGAKIPGEPVHETGSTGSQGASTRSQGASTGSPSELQTLNPITHNPDSERRDARATVVDPVDGGTAGSSVDRDGGDSGAHWRPPERLRPAGDAETDGDGTGKLDFEGGATTALEIATVHWVATGLWAKPSGRTLSIGPPPDDPAYRLSRSFLAFLIRDALSVAERGSDRCIHATPQVRGLYNTLRRALAGQEPEIDADDARARLAQVRRVLTDREEAAKAKAMRDRQEAAGLINPYTESAA